MSDANTRQWASAAEHVATYRESDGRLGHTWQDRPHLLLSTTGRRSGREHTVPLVYGRWRDRLVVVASAGGAESHPAWFLNLRDRPRVDVQLWAQRWSTTAEIAEGEDVEAAWRVMASVWQGFARYRAGTDRVIPVVLLPEPLAVHHEPGIPSAP